MDRKTTFRKMSFEHFAIYEQYGSPESYGVAPSPELFEKIGRAILVIAGADGEVTPTEMSYFLGLAKANGTPQETIDRQRAFDYKRARLEDYFDATTRPLAKVILFDAIRTARADGFHDKERAMARRGAERLGLDPAIVGQMEALLGVEDAVRNARLSILGTPERWEAPGRTSAGLPSENDFWRREQFGMVGPVPYDAATKVGKAILVVAGADGDLSETEMAWFLGNAKANGAPPEVIEEFMKFDYRGARLESLLDATTRPMARLVLYDAVRCAASDGFGEKEVLMARRAAKHLGVDANLVPWIDGVVRMEAATREARHRLLAPS